MIFGMAGVQGNGQVELVQMLTKTLPVQKGKITFEGQDIRPLSIREIRDGRFGYIPEDRLEQGVAGKEAIRDNMIANRVGTERVPYRGFLKQKEIDAYGRKISGAMRYAGEGGSQPISMLSGGNMQKGSGCQRMRALAPDSDRGAANQRCRCRCRPYHSQTAY